MRDKSPQRGLIVLIGIALIAVGCGNGGGDAGSPPSTATDENASTTAQADTVTTQADTATESTSAAEAEPQSLLVWNKDDTEVFAESLRLFEESHPGVEIELVDRSYDDYDTALSLAVTSDDPPDVMQVSYAYKAMGPLVEAGVLLPLNAYADEYGWWDRIGGGAASLSFTSDGMTYGEGELYGAGHAQGEVVGVYYNKDKLADLGLEVPTSFTEFEEALATALNAGELPLVIGGADAWPIGQAFFVLSNAFMTPDATQAWVYAEEGANFNNPAQIAAAQKLQDWAELGYFSADALGITYPASLEAFAGGEGVFMLQGSWANPLLVDAGMGENLGFFPLANAEGTVQAVTSTFGAPWSIGATTDSPNLAAEFVDLVAGPQAIQLMAEAGNLPSDPDATTVTPPAGSSQESLWNLWDFAVSEGLQVNFLEQAAPTLGAVFSPGLQEVLGGATSAEDWADTVQTAYQEFHNERLGR